MTLKERVNELWASCPRQLREALLVAAGITALTAAFFVYASRKDIERTALETRDIIFYGKPTTEDILSRERQKNIDCLLEEETLYSGNAEPVTKNKDGSVLVYRVAEGKYETSSPEGMVFVTTYGYYRADTKEGTQRKVAKIDESTSFSYSNCYLSPDGGFLVLPRKYKKDLTLEPEIRMYDHPARELIWINTTRAEAEIRVNSVSDKGVLRVTKALDEKITIDYQNMPSFLMSTGNEWTYRPVAYRILLE